MSLAALKERLSPHHRATKAYGRGSRMTTPEVLDWVDASLYAVGRSLSEWRKGERRQERGDKRSDNFFLDNARQEAEVILALIQLLDDREQGMTGREQDSLL